MSALSPGLAPMVLRSVSPARKYYAYLEGAIILENAPSPSPHHMGHFDRGEAFYLSLLSTKYIDQVSKAPLRAWASDRGRANEREERRLIDVANIEAAEHQINGFIERRAKGAQTGRDRANADAAWERASGARRTNAARLENARGWIEHFGALALMHHDAAARAAEKRDRAREIVRELEDDKGGTAA